MDTNVRTESLVQELNESRARIMDSIEEYVHLRGLMSEFENHFLAYVLLPSFQLQQAIQMSEYLEQEYSRISKGIEEGAYTDSDEVGAEINQVIRHADLAFAWQPRNAPYDSLNPMSAWATQDGEECELNLDSVKKERVIKEFKKVVLPKVHADTSNAPFEIFHTVYESYKSKDYLLMMAFTIQYHGEFSYPGEELSAFREVAPGYLRESEMVQRALTVRITKLNDDPTTQRLQNKEEVLSQMKKENREIRKAACKEAERLITLRGCLEDLVHLGSSKGKVN